MVLVAFVTGYHLILVMTILIYQTGG